MARFVTMQELREFRVSPTQTVDLSALISTVVPQNWVAPKKAPAVGTVAFAEAMGKMRMGVVVKTTPTKVHVALTTRGAILPFTHANMTGPVIRVQTVIADMNYVRVAPEPEPETPAEADERRWTVGAIVDVEAVAYTEKAEREEVSPSPVRETTGSSVVRLLERVHERIRSYHPEVPAMVIVTGAGIGNGSNKWGHFRPQGWLTKDKTGGQHHEMFMAGETLAKGAKQVLQTMLHESAHALAAVEGKQDTSRQGRWHNQEFRKNAERMGLEHKGEKADKTHGYSFVTLTEHTTTLYADLLEELDREIHLMVRLPVWLGGDAGEQGGEGMGRAPKTGEGGSNSGGLKLTCLCPEPNIIRASKKVAEKFVVNCGDCDATFKDRG